MAVPAWMTLTDIWARTGSRKPPILAEADAGVTSVWAAELAVM